MPKKDIITILRVRKQENILENTSIDKTVVYEQRIQVNLRTIQWTLIQKAHYTQTLRTHKNTQNTQIQTETHKTHTKQTNAHMHRIR